MIEELQEERGKAYGDYSANAIFVGNCINLFIETAKAQNRKVSVLEVGNIAYIAIKLARLTKSPNHEDTWVDLESYVNLARKEMTNGESTV